MYFCIRTGELWGGTVSQALPLTLITTQTGSGKTHTMFGTEESPGVAPRTVAFMLETLQSIESSSSR